MKEIPVFDIEGKEIEKIAVPEDIYCKKVDRGIMYSVAVNHLANRRMGTSSSKSRSEVRGGGRKPWRQKGTGRARAGTIRSPLWRGGSVIFGTKPRDYSYNVPNKVKRLALKGALSAKVSKGMMAVVDNMNISQPKTKELLAIFKKFVFKKALLVTKDKNAVIAGRNIPNIIVADPGSVNTYDVLNCEKVLITKEALSVLNARMSD